MAGHLSDSDLQRIANFAKTPNYKRNPELLLPADDD